MEYKTPGIYVEEITKFPPSVAEVATAIPAFIGYTEKAHHNGVNLAGKAEVVASLIEFEQRFGAGPAVLVDNVVLTESNTVSTIQTAPNYLLYDSIKLYFANGGGPCYIVSVGQYGTSPSKIEVEEDTLVQGLSEIATHDEPTLLLFPDATLLDSTQFYQLQQAALEQAAQLGDRFVILDLLEREGTDTHDEYKEFRKNIGLANLAYGAAYTPYLKIASPKVARYRNAKDSFSKHGEKIKLISLAGDAKVRNTISTLENTIADEKTLQSIIDVIKNPSNTLEETYQTKVDTLKEIVGDNLASEINIVYKFKGLCLFCYDLLSKVFDVLAGDSSPLQGVGLKSLHHVLTEKCFSEFSDVAMTLNSYLKVSIHAELQELYTTYTWSAPVWKDMFISSNVIANSSVYGNGASIREKLSNAEHYISALSQRLCVAVNDLQQTVTLLEIEQETLLLNQMPAYNNVVTAINKSQTVIPPSGAVAGIYCSVDQNRGVWKSPANVRLNSVADLTVHIDNADQEDLNVDVTAGKSINAIRMFPGRGFLVWGARTLAGNDNEWRYISVRRFFTMVEESVKRSTRWAVFEPNNDVLWTKVKAMIEHYLILKWREGALAGGKPGEAFFVNLGLGSTMSPHDVLEGRLIIEIGMAVLRPAEFIILRIIHTL